MIYENEEVFRQIKSPSVKSNYISARQQVICTRLSVFGVQDAGADALVPIFYFVVLMARLQRPMSICMLLRGICDSQRLEGGKMWALASFEAALYFHSNCWPCGAAERQNRP